MSRSGERMGRATRARTEIQSRGVWWECTIEDCRNVTSGQAAHNSTGHRRRSTGELRWIWDHEDGRPPAYGREEFIDVYADWIEANRASRTRWVALDGDAVVGMAFLVRTPRPPPASSTTKRFIVEIQSVYVKAGHPDAVRGCTPRLLLRPRANDSPSAQTVPDTSPLVSVTDRLAGPPSSMCDQFASIMRHEDPVSAERT